MPQPFTTLTSQMMPLLINDVDTDQIIPARFLKVTDKEGLGKVLFCDWRYSETVPTVDAAAGATPRPDFVLNEQQYQGARILVAGDNFGCGSSREHAPWALTAYGFRAIISTSFADIFRNNALKNGLLPISLNPETYASLLDLLEEAPQAEITVDLESQCIMLPGGTVAHFSIDPFARNCLLKGVDELGYLQAFEEQIRAYEEAMNV